MNYNLEEERDGTTTVRPRILDMPPMKKAENISTAE
jgi:hypothetical protein